MKSTQIKLIPISALETEDNVYTIPLEKAEYFAYIATTLKPLDAFREIDGYTSALWEYMQERKYQEQELYSCYDKFIHANSGHELLTTLIHLFLLEKDMRNKGITSDLMDKYEKLQNEYQYLLCQLIKK